MDTSVVIITRDELPLLQDTLAVLGETIGDAAGEYIVVDDGSKDGTADWLAAVEAVRLIHHTEKKGWMDSLNEGIASAHGESILVLRGGTLIPQVTWSRLRKALDGYAGQRAKAGAVYAMCSTAYWVYNNVPGIECRDLNELESAAEARPVEPDEATVFLDGHCMLLRRSAWQDVGGVRELYGDYREGFLDLAIRLWQAGWAVRRCPGAYVQAGETREADQIAAEERDGQLLLARQWHIRPGYSLHMRRDMLAHLDYTASDFSMLVAGCACGMDLMYVHDANPAAELHGIELDPNSAAIASTFAPVENIDIETLDKSEWRNRFSAVMMGDILEHLRDPWAMVRRMYEYTRPGGHIVISLPNVSHISVIEEMLSAHWQYVSAGILDRTHLRFFARNEAVELVTQAGYHMRELGCNKVPLNQEQTRLREALLPFLRNGAQPFDLDAYQWYILAEK